jgi:hypothetical protein
MSHPSPSETSVDFQRTTWNCIPQDSIRPINPVHILTLIFLTIILIFYLRLRQGFPSCFFLLDFPTNIAWAYEFLSLSWNYMPSISRFSSLCDFLRPPVTFSPLDQIFILCNLFSVTSIFVFPCSDGPSVAHTENNRLYCSVLYI